MKLLPASIVSLQFAAFGTLVFFGIRFRQLLLASPVLQPSLEEYKSLHRCVWVSTGAVIGITVLAAWMQRRGSGARTRVVRIYGALLVAAPTAGLLLFWLWLQHGTSW